VDDGESACSDESGGDEESFGCEEDVGGGEGGSRGGSPELAEISGRRWRTRGWG